jgi:hypothetical protein
VKPTGRAGGGHQLPEILEPADTVTHEATGLTIPVGELLPPVAAC